MPLVRCLRARLREDQSGFTLIEVLVSAAMLVLVSVGVLKTLDAASGRSGEQKAQSVGAALAQQDQERLRAFRAQELSNYSETRVKTVGTREYKIVSRTDWVSDQSGTRACGSGARADYIRISSTVLWGGTDDAETGDRRVSLTSIVAPRVGSFGDEGSLSIEILDRNGAGRADVPVSVTGPKSLNGTTDKNGCLLFGYLPQGNYTVDVSVPGLIDANGNANVSRQFGVNSGSITSAVIELDQAGSIRANVDNARTVGGQAEYLTIGHSGLAAPGYRPYGNGTTFGSYPVVMPNLFPFTSQYAVYSGNCPGANPSMYGRQPAWASVPPGGSTTVTVNEVALRIRRNGNDFPTTPSSLVDKVTLTWSPTTILPTPVQPTYCAGLEGEYDFSASSWVRRKGTAAPGDPGVPFGTYDVCVRWRPNLTSPYQRLAGRFEIDNPSGQTVNLPASGPAGTCP